MIGFSAASSTPTLDRWLVKLAGGAPQRIATRVAKRQQSRAREAAPVDRGALHVSISVLEPTTSDYAANVSDAQGLRPEAQFFPQPPTPAPDSASVVVGAAYGSLVNGGTIHHVARPFWDQAVLETAADLQAEADAEWQAAP